MGRTRLNSAGPTAPSEIWRARTRILIKHFRRIDLTDRCLQSVFGALGGLESVRITVIDGSAEEAPFEIRSHARGVDIASVPVEPSMGLVASFNRCCEGADVYVCLNNDTVLHPHCLFGMVKVIEEYPNVGIMAPLYDDPSGGWLYCSPPAADPGTAEWIRALDHRLAFPGTCQIVPHVDNCAWGFTQRLVDAIGLPDESFEGAGWGANLDYCYRARQAGFRVAVSLGSYLHHVGAATYGMDLDYRKKSEAQRDAALRRKYPNPSVVWV